MDDNLIIEDNVLKGCRQSKIITATIPEGIVAICDNAFSDFPNLMNITLPKSLSKIGNGVFQNCPKLTEIDLTDIAVIGEKAFSGCTALQNVLFGKRITYLANAIFLGCTSLTEIILPENIAYIGCECFKDCTSLTAIKYDGVMEIDNNAFENCGGFCNLALPKSLAHISPNAFSFCKLLDTVTVENRFIDIDETAFDYNNRFIFKAVQFSTAQSFALQNGYKFHPVILNDEYGIISGEQLDILAKSGILLFAKKDSKNEGKILIRYDISAKDRIIELIGGIQND